MILTTRSLSAVALHDANRRRNRRHFWQRIGRRLHGWLPRVSLAPPGGSRR